MPTDDEPLGDLDLGQTIRGLRAGQQMFGRYDLERILGRGGMGVVWLAHDQQLERKVALKFLPELIMHDRAVLDDLKRETVRSLQLTHHHIVRIYDFAQDAHSACISMEYVDGSTLSEVRVERPTRVLEVIDLEPLLAQVCAALDYAHSIARVVHRDLKPSNLMLSSTGELKIADFGIARSLSDSVSMLTMARTSSGTLPYMSPQQLDGEAVSHLDDIYSLGATFYELLTGKPPFYRGDISGQIRTRPPISVSARRQELEVASSAKIPPRWEALIARCLAKNPADRPQRAMDILDLGDKAGIAHPHSEGDQRPDPAQSEPPRGTSPRLVITLASLAVVLVGAVLWTVLRNPSPNSNEVADLRSSIVSTPTPTVPAPVAEPTTPPPLTQTPIATSVPVERSIQSPAAADGQADYREGLEFLAGLNKRPIDRVEAIARFRRAATAGLPEAKARLARVAHTGLAGSGKDAVQATEWASSALADGLADRAVEGIASAQVGLAILSEDGLGVSEDHGKAVALYTMAARQGDTFAQVSLGKMYANGRGVSEDAVEAATWYERAATAGNAIAQSYLGVAYMNGWGVVKDDYRAFSWFRQAADQGDAEGQMQLATMYEKGRGCEKSELEAAGWYRKSAEQGNVYGQTYLGMLFEKGRGVSQDYAQARDWYQKAATQGSAEGQMYLAGLYERGRGVGQDDTRAFALYRQAAEQGNGYGQTYLGSMYERGRGVAQDFSEAVKWYQRAANQGNSYGQTYLGAMYEKGRGVSKDMGLAISWYKKAAGRGNGEAKEAMNRLSKQDRQP